MWEHYCDECDLITIIPSNIVREIQYTYEWDLSYEDIVTILNNKIKDSPYELNKFVEACNYLEGVNVSSRK